MLRRHSALAQMNIDELCWVIGSFLPILGSSPNKEKYLYVLIQVILQQSLKVAKKSMLGALLPH